MASPTRALHGSCDQSISDRSHRTPISGSLAELAPFGESFAHTQFELEYGYVRAEELVRRDKSRKDKLRLTQRGGGDGGGGGGTEKGGASFVL